MPKYRMPAPEIGIAEVMGLPQGHNRSQLQIVGGSIECEVVGDAADSEERRNNVENTC
jgi:hypothetical protein